MKKLWLFLGRITYWMGRPVLAIIIRNSRRTRVVVTYNDSILLLQNWLGDGSWVLPGGGRHTDETAETGALRELQEEVGIMLEAGKLQHLGTHTFQKKGFRFSYDLFAINLTALPPLKPQRIEVSAIRWINRADLDQYKLGAEVRPALASWSDMR